MAKPKGSPFGFGLAAVALLAAYQWGLGPWLQTRAGEGWAAGGYLAFRVGILLAFCAILGARFGLTRVGVVRWGTLLGFFDQVVFKALWIQGDMKAHPDLWKLEGVALTAREIWINTAQVYVMFLPLTILLCLAGRELGMAAPVARRLKA